MKIFTVAAILAAVVSAPASAEPKKGPKRIPCEQWCEKYRPTQDCRLSCLAKPKGLQTPVLDRPG